MNYFRDNLMALLIFKRCTCIRNNHWNHWKYLNALSVQKMFKNDFV